MDRRTWKRKWDGARTKKQRNDARAKYQEACKEVKRLCRRDKREHAKNLVAEAETAARQGDLKTNALQHLQKAEWKINEQRQTSQK